MTSVPELLAANLHDVFGNRDPLTRRAAIERVCSEDVVFTDPEGTVHGRAALEDKAAALLAEAPSDLVFVDDGPRSAADDVGALAWAFGPTGAPVARGIDIITVVAQGWMSDRTSTGLRTASVMDLSPDGLAN